MAISNPFSSAIGGLLQPQQRPQAPQLGPDATLGDALSAVGLDFGADEPSPQPQQMASAQPQSPQRPQQPTRPQASALDQAINSIAPQHGVEPSILDTIAQLESGKNVRAKNQRSTASGPFQFIRSTAKQFNLNDPFDPVDSTRAAAQLTAQNSRFLKRKLGRVPTVGEIYLAHQQGAGGAARLLSRPNALASDIVGREAVRLNGADPDTTTAQEFASLWTSKAERIHGGASTGGVAPAPSAPPDEGPGLISKALSGEATTEDVKEGAQSLVKRVAARARAQPPQEAKTATADELSAQQRVVRGQNPTVDLAMDLRKAPESRKLRDMSPGATITVLQEIGRQEREGFPVV